MTSHNNKVISTRIIDNNYLPNYGLHPEITYKASIVSENGSVFDTIENITFENDYAEVTFSDSKPICSISASVKTKNIDYTEFCNIKWYSENGTYIKTGETLENVAEGEIYKYRITFNSDVLNDYFVAPEEQTVKAESEHTKAEYELKEIPSARIFGKVVDFNGKAIKNANISLTQTINKKDKTSTIITDSDGCFAINAKNAASKLVVKKTGYEIYEEATDSLTETEKTITLKKIETAHVTLNCNVRFLGR